MEVNWKEADDTSLVVAVGRWSEAALAEIYRRHGGSAFALAKRVLGDAARAEEVLQEVFLVLWEHPERFDSSRGTLRSYLLTIVHRRSVDVIRQDVSRTDRHHKVARLNVETTYDLEEEVWNLAVTERLKAALGELSAPERAAIELAYFEGYTYREVATALNQPEGTVKSRIRSGLKRLQGPLGVMDRGEQ